MSVGAGGTCALASPASIMPLPMATSECISVPSGSGRGCRDASMACTTSSSCSARGRLGKRLGMATLHLRSQALECAQLQLLDGSLTLAEALSNFTDAALDHKALLDDAALRFRKALHQLKEPRPVFDGAHVGLNAGIGRVVCDAIFASRALRTINDGVGGNSQQPGREGDSAPFIA